MPHFRHTILLILLTAIPLFCALPVSAQKYKVESFRMLENDVTAFVDPVADLNDEACALIKVQAPREFAFSTPLGIVKRVDKTGEIWLYIPKGSKKITLKHPQWGVLRDYIFPSRIESHLSYELRLDIPEELRSLPAGEAVVTVVHDTLVVTRTDTLMMAREKKRIPLAFIAEATIGIGGTSTSLSGGLMLALMKRHGGFIHLSTDFGRIGSTVGECGRDGEFGGRIPYYSGATRHSMMLATVGAIHRLSGKVRIFEGVGYGYDNTAWQLAGSEGGGFVRNSGLSHSGVAFEVGGMLTFGKVAVSLSVMSIGGRQWYGSAGVGISLPVGERRRR